MKYRIKVGLSRLQRSPRVPPSAPLQGFSAAAHAEYALTINSLAPTQHLQIQHVSLIHLDLSTTDLTTVHNSLCTAFPHGENEPARVEIEQRYLSALPFLPPLSFRSDHAEYVITIGSLAKHVRFARIHHLQIQHVSLICLDLSKNIKQP
jgi:hypothetical protein